MKPEVRARARGVFFDLYGTLLILGNMKQAWSDWKEVLYSGLRPPESLQSRAAFEDGCHQFFSKEQPLPTEDGLTVFERRIQRLGSSLGLEVGRESLQGVAARATNAWQAYVRADAAALEVLKYLQRSKTLALVSNFDHPPHARRVLKETGLDAFFKTIIISGEVGVKKPDPEIFRLALKAAKLSAEEVVYVGDTQEDVEGARAAGIRPILIMRPEDSNLPRLLDCDRGQEPASDRWAPVATASFTIISSLIEIAALV